VPALATHRRGASASGHLDQGVGAPLGGRALQVDDERVVAEALLRLGPVGVEQLPLDHGQRGVHDLARDRIERHPPEPQATDSLRQVHLSGGAVVVGYIELVFPGQLHR